MNVAIKYMRSSLLVSLHLPFLQILLVSIIRNFNVGTQVTAILCKAYFEKFILEKFTLKIIIMILYEEIISLEFF